MTPPVAAEFETRFLVTLQRLLGEGSFVATYKYALLLALADISVERGQDTGETLAVSTEQISALELLLDVANDFPDEPVVPFNLACYNAVLNKLAEAHMWLRIALEVAERNGTEKQWKQSALDEPDLAPLRKEANL